MNHPADFFGTTQRLSRLFWVLDKQKQQRYIYRKKKKGQKLSGHGVRVGEEEEIEMVAKESLELGGSGWNKEWGKGALWIRTFWSISKTRRP
jgi:hypothetical protein